ncbi:hypothetical protein [Bradyrhizobium brasilense]|uniref:Uncharacterized protein n=1 Tax=Bradyrhizobium brasilense TaxID=1419277 RepID=A0ABY8JDQ1_9BRAD|nr:hypothetical protein [Bradyrhizobium brasilense]WFU62741.1 hypothetical protein QA636_35740 [Bradyrhizobium brasilense]
MPSFTQPTPLIHLAVWVNDRVNPGHGPFGQEVRQMRPAGSSTTSMLSSTPPKMLRINATDLSIRLWIVRSLIVRPCHEPLNAAVVVS